jgi:hypothetical protein
MKLFFDKCVGKMLGNFYDSHFFLRFFPTCFLCFFLVRASIFLLIQISKIKLNHFFLFYNWMILF